MPHEYSESFEWVSLTEVGGSDAIIHRSPDGKRVTAAFTESGKFTFTYPFDEFTVVTWGTGKSRVRGGPALKLGRGDVAYFREGMTIDIELSDFANVTMLVSDKPVK